jgi:2,4-dienoyl-CoA reductase-like NADH-dependent reductase (Old Yellow Enzyme family)
VYPSGDPSSSTIPVVGGWANGVAGTLLVETAVGNGRHATEQGDAADEARLEAHGTMVREAHHPRVVRASQLIASVRWTAEEWRDAVPRRAQPRPAGLA